MAIPNCGSVHSSHWQPIEALVSKIGKEKQKFERLEMSKEDLLKMFANNEFKKHYIEHNVADGTRSTVYRSRSSRTRTRTESWLLTRQQQTALL